MNGNRWRMNGDVPKTPKASETILGFWPFPVLCDCGRISFFVQQQKHVPLSEKHVLDVFDQKSSNLVPILSQYG